MVLAIVAGYWSLRLVLRRDAGTLRIATGQWLPPTGGPPEWGMTIFNNDAAQPYFLDTRSYAKVLDFGRIPGPTSPRPGRGSSRSSTSHTSVRVPSTLP